MSNFYKGKIAKRDDESWLFNVGKGYAQFTLKLCFLPEKIDKVSFLSSVEMQQL